MHSAAAISAAATIACLGADLQQYQSIASAQHRRPPQPGPGQLSLSDGSASLDFAVALQQNVIASAIQQTEQLRSLSANWDGEGAAAPLSTSIDAAIAFLKYGAPPANWDAALHSDGRVILEAEAPDAYSELTFGPGDQVVAAIRIDDGPMKVGVLSLAQLLDRGREISGRRRTAPIPAAPAMPALAA